MVKCLPATEETRDCSLGQEDRLGKEMVTHSSILVWKIPWTKEPGKIQSMRLQRIRHKWTTSFSVSLFSLSHSQVLSIVNETEFVGGFFCLFVCLNSLAFSMIQQMLTVWSLVPLSFINPVWTSGSFGWHNAKA